jgi:predicted ArsR family transcriptional regulator
MNASTSATGDVAAVALLDEPVRRRLYEWVSDQDHAVGREEAARVLGISRPLAAFHLDRLTEAGLLEASYKRLTGRTGPGAGRPARVYQRAARDIAVSLPPRQYELVAEVFAQALQAIGGGQPPVELREAAHATGEQLARRARQAEGSTDLFGVLNAAGYEPAREADGTIRLRNCPFDALVDEHRPLVCGTNLALAEGLVDGAAPLDGTDYQPRVDAQPGYCCVVFRPAKSRD